MENKKIALIKKASKTTSTVLIVLEWIIGIAFALCIVGAVVCGIYKNDISAATPEGFKQVWEDGNFRAGMSFGILSFNSPMQKIVENNTMGVIAIWGCILGALSCAIAFLFMEFLRNIFASMYKNDTPFNPVTLKKIKVFGITSVILIFFFTSIGYGIIMALIVWCLYCVFDYGIELQKESDETL